MLKILEKFLLHSTKNIYISSLANNGTRITNRLSSCPKLINRTPLLILDKYLELIEVLIDNFAEST